MTLQEFANKINGTVWEKNGKIRIYFQTDKSAKAYLDYDENLGDEFQTGMEGARLCVFSDNWKCDRHWNINRAKQIKHDLMKQIAKITGDEVCDDWHDVIL